MEALEIAGALTLEDGRDWATAATDLQLEDMTAVLDTRNPRRHFQTRSRGYSKTTDAAAAAIAILLDQAPAQSRSFVYAADRDQAALTLDALHGFTSRTEAIRGALKVEAWRVTNTRNGASLDVQASDDASSWGTRPYFVIADELSAWKTTRGPRTLWRSIISSLPKVADSRLLVICSAGDPAHWSYRVLEQAQASDRWRVSEAEGPAPWLKPEDLEEQRRLLPEWEYSRLFENIWTAADDRITTLDDIRACVVNDGPQDPEKGTRYVVSLDVGLKKDRTVASVAHMDGDRVVLDRQETWKGSKASPVRLETVESWLFEASRQYNRAPIIFDPWQAQHLAQRLRSRKVRLIEFTFSASSVGRLALTLHRLLRDHDLALYDDPELVEELARVRLVETSPGSYRIDHDSDAHDDRAISLALAAQHLVASTPQPTPRLGAIDLSAGLGKGGHSRDFYTGRSTIGGFDYR